MRRGDDVEQVLLLPLPVRLQLYLRYHLHLHLGAVHPLQDVALHQCFPLSSVAFVFQVVHSFLAISSCHLLLGRPLDLFSLLGCHTVQRLVHLFLLQFCPARFHFCFIVCSSKSIIFVLFLISEHGILSFLFVCLFWGCCFVFGFALFCFVFCLFFFGGVVFLFWFGFFVLLLLFFGGFFFGWGGWGGGGGCCILVTLMETLARQESRENPACSLALGLARDVTDNIIPIRPPKFTQIVLGL